MLLTYCKIALRQLLKNKLYSIINLAGLTIGLVCCGVIGLYVQQELSYDKFVNNASRIVLLQQYEHSGVSGGKLAADMKQRFTQVETTVRLRNTNPLIHVERQGYYEPNFYFADSTVFSVFTFPLIAGNPNTALKERYGVVLTEATAKKYFPGSNALGKQIKYDNKFTLHVTGVMKNIPPTFHHKIDFLASYACANELAGRDVSDNYWGGDTWTYLLLTPAALPASIERQFPAYLRQLDDPNAAFVWKLHLVPLRDIYLKTSLIAASPITYVYIFTLIGFFILALACFNYINLSTARASSRAKEVGVRKVMGSSVFKLRLQFIIETTVFVLLALFAALLLIALGLPAFNQLAEKQLALVNLLHYHTIFYLIGGILVLSILAGIYPAFILSSFIPAAVLKGNTVSGPGKSAFRKTLVVLQFAVSTTMIAATLIVYQQLHFIRNKDLGYHREQILTLDLRDASENSKELFKQDVKKLAAVSNATIAYSLPGTGLLQGMKLVSDYVPGTAKDASIRRLTIDDGYLATFDIKLIEGRMLNSSNPSDKQAFLINETARKYFHWKDINGKMTGYYTFSYKPDGTYEEVPVRGQVVGVIADYNHADLKTTVEPMIISLNDGSANMMAVKLKAGSVALAVEQVKQRWLQFFPDKPFEYKFLDSTFDNTYKSEIKTARLFSLFAGLAILISCLGLLGLLANLADSRRKEIGIRKVLGASVGGIVRLLGKEFVLLAVSSWLFAFPLVWWAMNKWLQDFAYRVTVSGWIILLSGVAALFITILTICFQAFTVATANPVKNLRNE